MLEVNLRRSSPSIYAIAQEVGVSPSTVARILGGRSKGRANTRAVVLEAAAQMGYQPNLIAQGLSRGRLSGVGVLLESVSSFFMEVLSGVEKGLHESPYHPISVSSHWRLDKTRDVIDLLLAHRVSAIVVVGATIPAERLVTTAKDLPVVVTNRVVSGLEACCLGIDNVAAAERATRHLIELGHRHIVHLAGPPLHPDAADRKRGYERAMRAAGLPPVEVARGDFEVWSGQRGVEALLARGERFTALFAANDQIAFGARLALYERGLRVPRDVSLVGFDDLPPAAFSTPPLTTVRQPGFEMGLAAARLVWDRLEGKPGGGRTFPAELLVRASSGPPPVGA